MSLKLSFGEKLTLSKVGPGILSAEITWSSQLRMYDIVLSFKAITESAAYPLAVASGGATPLSTSPVTLLLKNNQPVQCYAEWTGANFFLNVGSQKITPVPSDLQRFLNAVIQPSHIVPLNPGNSHSHDSKKLSTGAIAGIVVGV